MTPDERPADTPPRPIYRVVPPRTVGRRWAVIIFLLSPLAVVTLLCVLIWLSAKTVQPDPNAGRRTGPAPRPTAPTRQPAPAAEPLPAAGSDHPVFREPAPR